MFGNRIRLGGWGAAALALALACSPGVLAADAPGKAGLHIPRTRRVSFTAYLHDGAGFRWDLQYQLNVGSGTNYAYGGGLYCRVHGSNVTSNGMGWMNAAGDEIEIGPYNRNNCEIYRRCKVYRDQGLARWLDVFVNNTSSAMTLPVQIYTCTSGGIDRVVGSSGSSSFRKKDWAFITQHQAGRPALLHIVCGVNSKLRPNVRVSGNQIYCDYSVTVPAKSAAVLCYFESQAHSVSELQKRLKQFRLRKALGDLPPAVRKLIANFQTASELEAIELERVGTADTVVLGNGDTIYGRIVNETFVLEAFYGTLELPAAQVVGVLSTPQRQDLVRAVLVGGQVLTGKLRGGALHFALPTGGEPLKIPFSRVKECSYQISKDKPAELAMTDPLILLRTGDRLAFDPDALACTFRTRRGSVPLKGGELLEVRLDHREHGVHRATFLNGSKLAGMLEPERIALPLKLGPKLDIPREMVRALRFAAETEEDPKLTRVKLTNEDELFGQILDEAYTIVTDFGVVEVKSENLLGMSFDRADPSRVVARLWDGSTLRGFIQADGVRFGIRPGPVLSLPVGHIRQLDIPDAMPPEDVVRRVEKYVATLSAASYKDREEAQEALIRMGRKIGPLLTKGLADSDPEVRQRITVILEKIGIEVPEGGDEPSSIGPDSGRANVRLVR